jgi:hypothetical protein
MIALFGLLVASVIAAAPATPAPCSAPEYRQFDFWIGSWTVKDASGQLLGTNMIDAIQDGCAIQEHWKGTDGSAGTSFSIYYAPAKQWHQTWVDAQGGLLRMDGGIVNGAMVMQGTRVGKRYKSVIDKTTWTPLPDGRVRQFWVTSVDGGATWKTLFDGYYQRAS